MNYIKNEIFKVFFTDNITYILLLFGYFLLYLHFDIEHSNSRLVLIIIGNWLIAYIISSLIYKP